jgi:hypothetical protein
MEWYFNIMKIENSKKKKFQKKNNISFRNKNNNLMKQIQFLIEILQIITQY